MRMLRRIAPNACTAADRFASYPAFAPRQQLLQFFFGQGLPGPGQFRVPNDPVTATSVTNSEFFRPLFF